MTDFKILQQPIVEIGGVVGFSHSIIFLMHEGFDRLGVIDFDNLFKFSADKPDGTIYMVGGNRSNPYARWPVYMRVKRRR